MKKGRSILLLVLTILFVVSQPASAMSILSSFDHSGTPGNYLLNFSLTNNIPVEYSQNLYFFGVDLAYDPAQGSPSGWNSWGGTWNNLSYGGSSRNYPSNWMTGSSSGVASGETLSGFTVQSPFIPDTVHFYAFGIGDYYNGEDAFYRGWEGYNPGFEGIVGVAVDNGDQGNNVIPEPATVILFGTGLFGAFLRKRALR